jgi:hypothetical protein
MSYEWQCLRACREYAITSLAWASVRGERTAFMISLRAPPSQHSITIWNVVNKVITWVTELLSDYDNWREAAWKTHPNLIVELQCLHNRHNIRWPQFEKQVYLRNNSIELALRKCHRLHTHKHRQWAYVTVAQQWLPCSPWWPHARHYSCQHRHTRTRTHPRRVSPVTEGVCNNHIYSMWVTDHNVHSHCTHSRTHARTHREFVAIVGFLLRQLFDGHVNDCKCSADSWSCGLASIWHKDRRLVWR